MFASPWKPPKARTITVRQKLGPNRKILVVHAALKPFRADLVIHPGREVEATPMAAETGRLSVKVPLRFPRAMLPSALGHTGS